MYTETSIGLKSDFYCRYGTARGRLLFERTGVPCVVMDSGSHMLAFAMDCGTRAYGRGGGDVVKVMNASSNVCDAHFAEGGYGAQILYREDVPGLAGMRETTEYTVNKLLRRMQSGRALPEGGSGIVGICDRCGSGGWCAYVSGGTVCQIPLPLEDFNVLLIRTGKHRPTTAAEAMGAFKTGETRRIITAADALRECRTDVFFDMLGESERAIELLLPPRGGALCAVRILNALDGVAAARICRAGVVCFAEKRRTDSVIHSFGIEYEREIGSPAGISVVK